MYSWLGEFCCWGAAPAGPPAPVARPPPPVLAVSLGGCGGEAERGGPPHPAVCWLGVCGCGCHPAVSRYESMEKPPPPPS
eukprot:scaffold8681_cov73-Isochrysis_galbana.AAC.2